MFKGTREGRVYPDIWKRLPIKIASTERQQQIARLVDAVQVQYQVKAQGEQIRATINTILSEIEALVEATYREPADTDRVVIIDRVMTYGMSQPLF